MEEIWNPIPGYEGIYEASNFGNIKSMARIVKSKKHVQNVREVILRQSVGNGGYLILNLCLNGSQKSFQVHQLVAMSFLGHTRCGFDLIVNHIDGNRKNNRLDNLNLITQRENGTNIRKNVSSRYPGVYYYAPTKKWKSQILFKKKRYYLGRFESEYLAYLAYVKFAKDNDIVLMSSFDAPSDNRHLCLF